MTPLFEDLGCLNHDGRVGRVRVLWEQPGQVYETLRATRYRRTILKTLDPRMFYKGRKARVKTVLGIGRLERSIEEALMK
jgi:hypothetical protein